MADAATVLFRHFLRFDAAHPHWQNRDRFVLSAGHGSMLLYSLLWLTGYPGISLDDIKTFRKKSAALAPAIPNMAMHRASKQPPDPLGQGISNAVGMAIAERRFECPLRR